MAADNGQKYIQFWLVVLIVMAEIGFVIWTVVAFMDHKSRIERLEDEIMQKNMPAYVTQPSKGGEDKWQGTPVEVHQEVHQGDHVEEGGK